MSAKTESSGLRELIIDEATRLFATKGFAGTSIRELAEACECTKPALYYYFPSKEALFIQVFEFHAAHINGMLDALLGAPGPVRERLHSSLDRMVDHCTANPLAMQLLQRFERSPEASAPEVECVASHETHLGVLTQLISMGIEQGELRSEIDPTDGALLLAGAMNIQFEASIATGNWNRSQMHRIADLVLDGIAK